MSIFITITVVAVVILSAVFGSWMFHLTKIAIDNKERLDHLENKVKSGYCICRMTEEIEQIKGKLNGK